MATQAERQMGTDHCVTPTATDVDFLHQQFLIGLLIPSAVGHGIKIKI